jgi:threonyl-tRNA synthetase
VLADQLLRFTDAPEPNAIGKRVLADYWTESISTLRERVRGAHVAAKALKESLFEDGAVSRDVLGTVAEHFDARFDSIEPLNFEALLKLRNEINELVTTVLGMVVEHAIDQELGLIDAETGDSA